MTPILRDGTTLDAAYRAFASRAIGAATRVLHDPAAAEDVVQEVFIELMRRPVAFDPERGSLGSYVTMLARSRALDHMRANASSRSAQERCLNQVVVPLTPDAETPPEAVVRRERSQEVLAAVDELPPKQRAALLMGFGLGMSAGEVAQASQVPIGTAKSRMRLGLSRARVTLAAAA